MPPRKKATENTGSGPKAAAGSISADLPDQNARCYNSLQNVMKDGKLDPVLEKRNNAILKAFLDSLIPAMKTEDKHFASLYHKLYFTGSYYEKLRISDPNEFDINLVLKLPFGTDVREIEYVADVKSFVKYKLKIRKETNKILEENKEILTRLFEGEYLMPVRVRNWIQSIIDRVLRSPGYSLPKDVKKIIPSASGPAKTMFLETWYGNQIDIDLVPVIQFSHPEWPKGARDNMLRNFNTPQQDKFWFMVPKDYCSSGKDVNVIDSKRLWRIHFPEIEKKIIHDKGCVKPVIKFLKALRNNEKWVSLASYYLKTIVMWKVEKNNATDHWKMDSVGHRLIECLESLKECVQQKMIKYYFYPDFNLIEKMNGAEATKISNRLERILNDIRANPEKVEIYFKMHTTK